MHALPALWVAVPLDQATVVCLTVVFPVLASLPGRQYVLDAVIYRRARGKSRKKVVGLEEPIVEPGIMLREVGMSILYTRSGERMMSVKDGERWSHGRMRSALHAKPSRPMESMIGLVPRAVKCSRNLSIVCVYLYARA